MRTTTLANSLAIMLLAGTPAAMTRAIAQDATMATHRAGSQSGAVVETPVLIRTERLRGTGIVNDNAVTVAQCSDFIFHRGTGRVEYVVLADGGILGIGGKQVAVPLATFGFDHAENRFRLDVTPEVIDQAAEFLPGEWVPIEGDDWAATLAARHSGWLEGQTVDRRDPFATVVQNAEVVRLSGRIDAVHRKDNAFGDEQVEIDVRNDEGIVRRVVLGPSWFVMGTSSAPMRLDPVELEVYELPRDTQGRLLARSGTIDGERVALRDGDGHPHWDSVRPDDSRGSESDVGVTSPWMLVSDLVGLEAYARDEYGGEIDDVVIELNSGQITLLYLDPDENILGIADTQRVVPWPVIAVGQEAVRIDADREMILNSQAAPDDLPAWAGDRGLERAYRPFGIEIPQFRAQPRTEWSQTRTLGGWARDGVVAQAVESGRDVEVSGTIDRITTTRVADGTWEASTLQVRTGDGQIKTVVLGPYWYVQRQDLDLESGQRVTVQAKQTEINGSPTLLACEVRAVGGNRIVLWDGDEPMWDAR
ncbi:MAG: PRC-barrel domain-containing protein [Phycisphaerales bacterium]